MKRLINLAFKLTGRYTKILFEGNVGHLLRPDSRIGTHGGGVFFKAEHRFSSKFFTFSHHACFNVFCMLEFSSFSKKYTRRPVLNIGDLLLPEGIVWLQGANGAGKSTLMKCAAGMLSFKGDIMLAGEKISLKQSAVKYRQKVNISEADPIFPSFLKGTELIDFFKKAKGGSDVQVDHYIELLRARSFVHERIGTYSSGMNKKLSLILALLGNPSVILLDEPLITLDQEAQRILYDIITQKANGGCHFLIATHQELTLPMQLEVHKVSLSDGKLLI